MIETEIMGLNNLDRAELQTMWREYFKTEPISQNKKFYISRLAYRLQELSYGGLPKDLKEKLLKSSVQKQESKSSYIPPVGTRIVKTYQGEEYCIKVLKDGFDFAGRRYKSLSAVALKITGQKISGNFFFGFNKIK